MKKDTNSTVDCPRTGHLVIVGGKENHKSDMVVLEHFVALSGGADANIIVLTAASDKQDEMWSIYESAFAKLGIRHLTTSNIKTREDAYDEATAVRLFEADGIFITGGDQKRLMALIGGTQVDNAIYRALCERGACIGGTSAGASAMSEHMLFDGNNDQSLQKESVHLGAGLGLMRRVIIDQHFSERQRLGRLVSAVAQNPYLLGLGIDENTALIIRQGKSVEVIGDGAVTLIDGRGMLSNSTVMGNRQALELADVQLHLLPSGVRYDLESLTHADDRDKLTTSRSPGLNDAIAMIASLCGVYRDPTEHEVKGE